MAQFHEEILTVFAEVLEFRFIVNFNSSVKLLGIKHSNDSKSGDDNLRFAAKGAKD